MTLGLWMTSFLLPPPNPGMSPLAAAVAFSPPLRFSSFVFGKKSVWTGMPRLNNSRCAFCNYAQQRSFGGGKLNFLGGNLRSVLCRDTDLRSPPPTYLPTYTYAPTKNLLDLKILLCVASSPPPGQR